MEIYPYSWIYYMTFIFFTAFAFLNMVIGIVVNVMEEERSKVKNKNQPTLSDLKQEITELKTLILQLDNKKSH
jgi:voltage-gated sodium channel